jgi:hypothetical protein
MPDKNKKRALKKHFIFWIIATIFLFWISLKGELYAVESLTAGACGLFFGAIDLIIYFRLAKNGIFVLPIRSTNRALLSALPIAFLFLLASVFFRKSYFTFLVLFVFVYSFLVTFGIYFLEHKYGGKFVAS